MNHRGIHSDFSSSFVIATFKKTHDARHVAKLLLIPEWMPQSFTFFCSDHCGSLRACVREEEEEGSHPSNDSSTVVLTVRIPTSFLPVIVRQNLMIGPNAIAKMSMHHNTVLAVSWPEGQLGRCPVASRNRINLCNIQPCLHDESYRCFAPLRQRVHSRHCHTWQPRRESQNRMIIPALRSQSPRLLG